VSGTAESEVPATAREPSRGLLAGLAALAVLAAGLLWLWQGERVFARSLLDAIIACF
jgi:hypothetical protein